MKYQDCLKIIDHWEKTRNNTECAKMTMKYLNLDEKDYKIEEWGAGGFRACIVTVNKWNKQDTFNLSTINIFYDSMEQLLRFVSGIERTKPVSISKFMDVVKEHKIENIKKNGLHGKPMYYNIEDDSGIGLITNMSVLSKDDSEIWTEFNFTECGYELFKSIVEYVTRQQKLVDILG